MITRRAPKSYEPDCLARRPSIFRDQPMTESDVKSQDGPE